MTPKIPRLLVRSSAPSATHKGSRMYVPADPRVEGRSPEDPWLRSGHPQGVQPRTSGIGRGRWIFQKRAGVLCAVRLVRLVR